MKNNTISWFAILAFAFLPTVALGMDGFHNSTMDDIETALDSMHPKPIGQLTQSYLMGVTRHRDIVEFPYFIPEERVKQYKTYNVVLSRKRMNRDKFSQSKYDGRLIAICDSGIFLYKSKKHVVRYYPYRYLWSISKGVTNAKLIGNFALGGAGIGLFVGPPLVQDLTIGAIAGFVLGGAYGVVGSVYYIVGRNVVYRFSRYKYVTINSKTAKGILYHAKALKYSEYFRKIDLLEFPLGDTTQMMLPAIATVSEIDVNEHSSATDSTIAKVDVVPSNVEAVTPVAPASPEAAQNTELGVSQQKSTIGEFESAKGFASQWMVDGFVAADVRTGYLVNQFAWIRQKAITNTDLKKLKSKSEIQFLAQWITTAAGYSFREVVAYDKDQLAFIQPKEPYLAETVVKGTVVDPMVLLVVDVENLKVLYEELRLRQ